MASTSPYKQYSRGRRQATLDADFSSGMMFTNGVVTDGFARVIYNFDYSSANNCLIPRSGLHTSEIIFPDMNNVDTAGFDLEGITIKDAKDCIEDGEHYRQFILGKEGKIWAVTSKKNIDHVEVTLDDNEFDVDLSTSKISEFSSCKYYHTGTSDIHGSRLDSDTHSAFPVGTFAFGNSFYFFNDTGSLCRSFFSPFSNIYAFEELEPKTVTAAEAVTYGYNMLSDSPYTFEDRIGGSNVIQFNGILPYADENFNELMMTPKKNQSVYLRCYYDAPVRDYEIVWEWREVSASDWNELYRDIYSFTQEDKPVLTYANFKPSAKDIMIRVTAYPIEDSVISDYAEKGMTVGFDFSQETYGNTLNLNQEEYDLSTATGMTSWDNRLVLWGVPEDPTILWISDMNEPTYFPYPNNITVFDEPIITALEFMGNLVVFTTSKIYQVEIIDGSSWKSTVLQSNLSINAWDKHLIQPVRNMLFFKSGNYYYMLVPKAQSTTGELTIAPITTNITYFFDHFKDNVQKLLNEVYDYEYDYYIASYFNYLDYEDVVNSYILKRKLYGTNVEGYVHFNIVYNVVSRRWRITVYDAPNIYYPYKHDATKRSTLASTFLINIDVVTDEGIVPRSKRILQVYDFDERYVRDFYIPQYSSRDTGEHVIYSFVYDTSVVPLTVVDRSLTVPSTATDFSVSGTTAELPFRLVDSITEGQVDTASVQASYYEGFYKPTIREKLKSIFISPDEYSDFRNWQHLDTGYRSDNLHLNKRYREIQLQLNNIDSKDMQFKLDYYLDGAPRSIKQKFEPEQYIEEMDNDWGTVYLDAVPYMDVAHKDIDLSNLFTIYQELIPEVTLWKIRTAVSGKGAAPRVTLTSRNHKRYELLGINWIYRIMNMR